MGPSSNWNRKTAFQAAEYEFESRWPYHNSLTFEFILPPVDFLGQQKYDPSMLLRDGMQSRAVVTNQDGNCVTVRIEGLNKDGVWKPVGFDPTDPEDVDQVRRNWRKFKQSLLDDENDT